MTDQGLINRYFPGLCEDDFINPTTYYHEEPPEEILTAVQEIEPEPEFDDEDE